MGAPRRGDAARRLHSRGCRKDRGWQLYAHLSRRGRLTLNHGPRKMSIGRRRTIEIDRTPAQPDQAAVGAALSVLDRFMVALNAGDEPALLATLHCMRHEGAEGAVPTFALLLANHSWRIVAGVQLAARRASRSPVASPS